MKKGNTIYALFGIFLLALGIIAFIGALASTVIGAFLGLVGITSSIFSSLQIWGVVLGIVFGFIGFRIYESNQDPLSKLAMGLFGVLMVIGGVIAVIAGSITGGASLFATLLLWALGAGFIDKGFEIDLIDNAGKLANIKN